MEKDELELVWKSHDALVEKARRLKMDLDMAQAKLAQISALRHEGCQCYLCQRIGQIIDGGE